MDTLLTLQTNQQTYQFSHLSDPRAYVKAGKGQWKEMQPTFKFLYRDFSPDWWLKNRNKSDQLLPSTANAQSLELLHDSLPKETVYALSAFDSHQWNLLQLYSENHDETNDLLDSNPLLTYCLANCNEFRQVIPGRPPSKTARWQLKRKQQEILNWLGFPSTKSMVKLMRKLPATGITPLRLRIFQKVLSLNPALLDYLSHVPQIDTGLFSLITSPCIQKHLSGAFLHDFIKRPQKEKSIDLLIEILYLYNDLDSVGHPLEITAVKNYKEYLGDLRSLKEEMEKTRKERPMEEEKRGKVRRKKRKVADKEQKKRKDEWEEKVRNIAKKNNRERIKNPWMPPFPGNMDIHPIKNPAQLGEEGQRQNNCVASYQKRVEARRVYIYRLVYPERATFSIKFQKGNWVLDEIKGNCNQRVKASTRKYVKEWLNAKKDDTLLGLPRRENGNY